jgi:diguanylate cyclase (GGDEF)-like protein/PAS domain S-box-containing protein
VVDRRRDEGFLMHLLDASPGIVFVVDEGLAITWANRATSHLLGYEVDEVIGRSILEFLDVDWNPEAIESIGTAIGSAGGVRPPMLFRVKAKDGSRPILEAQANVQLDDPTIQGIVTYARRWTAQWLLDRTLDSVATGDPILETLQLLVGVVGAEPMDAPASILFDPVDGRVTGVAASAALAPALRGPIDGVDDDVAAAWRPLLRARAGRVHEVAALDEPLRSLASAAGYVSLWIWPTDLDQADAPTVWAVAWRDEPRLDVDQTRTGTMARIATVGAFALSRWRAEKANAWAATHDSLTGLWNRPSIVEFIERSLAADDDTEKAGGVAVVYLDLDRFKPINDRYGHAAGDRVLVEVAARLAAAAPSDGRLGRFGGDEFVYAGPAAGEEHAARLATALAEATAGPIDMRTGEVVRVGASVGSAFGRPATAAVDELLDRADRALYRAKFGAVD